MTDRPPRDTDRPPRELLVVERDTPEGLLVSVCDRDILGETFEDGDISLTVSEAFYGGEHAETLEADAVVDCLARATVANIVGIDAVSVAIDAGVIDEANVLEIDSTKHAQLLRMG